MSTGIGLADLLLSRSDADYVNRYTYLVTEDNKHEFLYVDRIYKRYMEILLVKVQHIFTQTQMVICQRELLLSPPRCSES